MKKLNSLRKQTNIFKNLSSICLFLLFINGITFTLPAAEQECGVTVIVNVDVSYWVCEAGVPKRCLLYEEGTSVSVMIYDYISGVPISDGIGIVSEHGIASISFRICPGAYRIEGIIVGQFFETSTIIDELGLSTTIKLQEDEACPGIDIDLRDLIIRPPSN